MRIGVTRNILRSVLVFVLVVSIIANLFLGIKLRNEHTIVDQLRQKDSKLPIALSGLSLPISTTRVITVKEGTGQSIDTEQVFVELVITVYDPRTGNIVDNTFGSANKTARVSLTGMNQAFGQYLLGKKAGTFMRIITNPDDYGKFQQMFTSNMQLSEGAIVDVSIVNVYPKG